MISVIFSLGYSSVRTGAFENNIASIRVMEKSGMKKCDHTEFIEYNGTIHNCIFYMKRVDD
jgi:RimJ/RimL family protein N-acetyltransferase